MKTFFSGLFLVVAGFCFLFMVLVGGCFMVVLTAPTPIRSNNNGVTTVRRVTSEELESESEEVEPEIGVFTARNYYKLRTGMTLAEVQELIGPYDSRLAESQIGGHRTVIYVWKNYGGLQNCNVTFQDGKVVMMAQFGF